MPDHTLYRITRRSFLGAGAAVGAAGPLPVIFTPAAEATAAPVPGDGAQTGSAPAPGAQADAYLQAAEQAARWIRSAEVRREAGISWLPDPDHPDRPTTVGPENTVYSGSAGTALFFIELAHATGDQSYLRDATRAADHLAASWQELPGGQGGFLHDGGLSFDQGLAGVAFALAETWKATQDARYRDAALAATQALAGKAVPAGAGVEWTGSPAVGLDGGIVLYLLYAARSFHDDAFLRLAQRAGERIVQRAESDPRGGLRWQGLPRELAAGAGLPADAWFPNFELGTAGVAFVLARLYEDTKQQRFLDAARAGAHHIRSIATVRGDSALVYYREPDLKDLYYLGYCHGPAGTARLFYQLHKVGGEASDLEWTEKLARGIVRSGVPEKLTPGYWNVACQCCGAAAVTDLFLSLWNATGKAAYRDFARRVADQLISREDNPDGRGYRWYQAWTRVKPWEVDAQTGWKIGASGVGSALIHTHLAARQRYSAILFPDNPFPREQRT